MVTADSDAVTWSSTTLAPDAMEDGGHRRSWSARLVHWAAEARSHRVICLVLGIWLLNGFDLTFTLLSHEHGLLNEENPVAKLMLKNGVLSIVLFKIGLVLIGSYPLLRFRRIRLAELAAYLILAAYVLLALRWSTCFELYTLAMPDHLDLADIEAMNLTSPQ